MALSLKEAAHRLRMTVKLLLWFKSYSPKGDGRKLRIVNESVEQAELDSFNEYLLQPWPDRYPPAEIVREIARESRGLCGLCRSPWDLDEVAHIDRKDKEVAYYSQHPSNLISLCPNCHTRYDRGDKLSNDQIKHAKQQRVAELMADVDRDMEMQRSIREYVAIEAPKFLAATFSSLGFASALTQHAQTVVTGSAAPPPSSTTAATAALSSLSGSIEMQSPITAKVLSKYAVAMTRSDAVSDVKLDDLFDDSLPQPGKCYRDGADTAMETASCTECGEDPGFHEVVVPSADGYELFDEDIRGGTSQVVCECGCKTFDVEFESLCSYCAHMSER